MSAPFAELDAATGEQASALLARCCGSARWIERMLALRPYGSDAALHAAADAAWAGLERADYLEAFAHHPRLGEDPARLRERFATAAWATSEQAGVARADGDTLEALRVGNLEYERRFGFVFLLCATGKGAREAVSLLEARMENDPDEELRVAASEQSKITHLRLEKLAS